MSYNSQSIKVLKGLEACRKRPGMYIGNTSDGSGLHHMIYEILDNSIDEHLEKHCDYIRVCIEKDNYITVEDNGRGIPVDIHKEEGVSAAIVIMTVLHAGGKFDQDSYKVSAGLHGVGAAVVNALSKRMELFVHRDGKEYFVAFEKGYVAEDLREIGPSSKRGTLVRFYADSEIFGVIEYDLNTVIKRIEHLVYLNPGLKILLEDERSDFKKEFYEPEGVVAFAKSLLKTKKNLHDAITFNAETNSMLVTGAAFWTDSYSEEIHCFTNTIPQKDGGTHLVGLKVAFTRSVNNYIQKDLSLIKKLKDLALTGDDIREGLVCILAVYMPEPQFSSQTKDKLVTSSIRPVVEDSVSKALDEWLEENPLEAKKIISKIVDAALARDAARKSRDLIRNNKSTEFSLSMATKLASCTSKDPTQTELFIVEGDSAGGSAKMARNRMFQAILPLRGKILNVAKANLNKMLNDEGIRTLIAVLGTSIGETFDITKIRYNKIVLMTDADIDGSHILTLLITFFFKYMRPIIENGFLYVAQPPLYGIKQGSKMRYLIDDQALADFLLENNLDKMQISKNGKNYSSDDLKIFIKNLFDIASYVNSKGIIAKACLCAKIDPENCDPQAILEYLKMLSEGEWSFEANELSSQSIKNEVENTSLDESNTDETYIEENKIEGRFIRKINGLNYVYDFNLQNFNHKFFNFISNFSDFWGNDINLVFNNEEKKLHDPMLFYDLLNAKGSSSFHIQRYKGLGEMNPEDLASTAMQSYLQVTYDNEAEASELIEKLMGEDVVPRKQFIQEIDDIQADD